jgi:hypothetical protein
MAKQLAPGEIKRLFEKNLGNINQKFYKEVKQINLPQLVIGLILKGISPVAGAVGRFIQYSKSYIDQIQGKAKYFTAKNGYVIRVEPKLLQGEQTKIKFKKGQLIQGKTTKAKYEKFEKGLGVGKRVSPVNLKVSGKMLETLSFNERTGVLKADHELWEYHNDGLGKLPERRLLPNRPGELFNRRVQQKVTESLAKALGLTPGKVKKFIKVKYDIR